MKITDIFDYFSEHKAVRRGSLLALSLVFICLLTTLHFSEDISDFLPLGTKEREQMSVYQNISGANKLFILFSNPTDPDYTVEAIDSFADMASQNDSEGSCGRLTSQVDIDAITQVSDFVYENIPYFLTDGDIARMDSLLCDPDYIRTTLAADRQALMFPSSSVIASSIVHDPLRLFSPVMGRLQSSFGQVGFELYENHIFTPDMSRAVVMLDSPFGSSETSNNSKLIEYLEKTSKRVQEEYPDVTIDIIGGPAIAVGNSSRIKKDSILAISLSLILILLLLAYSFNSLKNILLIFLTVGWGALFALGGLALFRDNVSIIVIGIASVIFGIAVNYPLHLISHTVYQPNKRMALSEIATPLVVGNITTVGAFLALVPLKSTALRDLGMFASLLLVGTIVFVLLFLPHYITVIRKKQGNNSVIDYLSGLSPEKHKWIIFCTIVITVLLLFFSFRTEFDSNMSHINYMTERQSKDMQYFEDLLTNDPAQTSQTLYIYGGGNDFDDALSDFRIREGRIDSLEQCGLLSRQTEAALFFSTRQEQIRKLNNWRSFIDRHQAALTKELIDESVDAGFTSSAFSGFVGLIEGSSHLTPQDIDYFAPVFKTLFSQNYTELEEYNKTYVVSPVNVEPKNVETVKEAFGDSCFEIAGINKAMTSSLSDNFNYIGWACSLIVFIFLWFSFGRIELAIISFLPMAVSWIWILGLMALLGIKFNIVNIILATFIFGQGDDYTIFMTEGCQYEYSRRRPILKSYKSSIIQSAAIMFVGIGTLIVAKHPALRSLAEVTIIGMFSVVLMAYMLPPLLFEVITTKNARNREYPITINSLLFGIPKGLPARVEGRYIYKGKEIERCVHRSLKEKGEEVMTKDLSGLQQWDYYDEGFGELSLLSALSHPDVIIISHIADEERRRIAMIAAKGVVNNIEFQK